MIVNAGGSSNFVCADCGASDPQWSVLNRGVLVCAECCYVHRNLGRHVSQVRSLSKGAWHPSQLALATKLYKNGANSIWEHSLIVDAQNSQKSSSRRKPLSNDPIIPKKEAFILAKYLHHEFTIRPTKDDLSSSSPEEFSQQLWFCVRTAHVETSLRLLALGASAEYSDSVSGDTPLHVAAKEGQSLQVELLWLYGADVGQRNASGQTPREIALAENHHGLAARLLELEFEVTDRLSHFLCGRMPDHHCQPPSHFLIPEIVGPPVDYSLIGFKRLLQSGSGVMLERLTQDIFDEVDRRDLNAQWMSCTGDENRAFTLRHVALFLPPNPKFTATRNQMRQKFVFMLLSNSRIFLRLAKFDHRDFAQLVIDILRELRRRHFSLPLIMDPDEHEKSAHDRDSSSFLAHQAKRCSNQQQFKSSIGNNNAPYSAGENQSRLPEGDLMNNGGEARVVENALALDNYLELREKQSEICDRLDHLTALVQQQMQKNLKGLQESVDALQIEHFRLRSDFDEQQMFSLRHPASIHRVNSPPPQVGAIVCKPPMILQRPMEAPKNFVEKKDASFDMEVEQKRQQLQKSATTTLLRGETCEQPLSRSSAGEAKQMKKAHQPFSFAERKTSAPAHVKQSVESSSSGIAAAGRAAASPLMQEDATASTTPSFIMPERQQTMNLSDKTIQRFQSETSLLNQEVFPDNLILETEKLTGAIKRLLGDLEPAANENRATGTSGVGATNIQSTEAANNSTASAAVFHADSINFHIVRILNVIPVSIVQPEIQQAMSGLEASMRALNRRCLCRPVQAEETCEAAYDVARAAKQLLLIAIPSSNSTLATTNVAAGGERNNDDDKGKQ